MCVCVLTNAPSTRLMSAERDFTKKDSMCKENRILYVCTRNQCASSSCATVSPILDT